MNTESSVNYDDLSPILYLLVMCSYSTEMASELA